MDDRQTATTRRALHRTPWHIDALENVSRRQIRCRPGRRSFLTAAGLTVSPGPELVALHELRDAGYISVHTATGTVQVTAAGQEFLRTCCHSQAA